MTIIEIKKNSNGAHNNQTINTCIPVPKGYALLPDDLETPNFPFGEIDVSEMGRVPTVTKWTALPLPEQTPEKRDPTQLDKIQAQVTYTALKTNTLIGGTN